MFTRGEALDGHSQQRFDDQQRQRSIASLRRHSAALGSKINPMEMPT